jgi:hypothetical protein
MLNWLLATVMVRYGLPTVLCQPLQLLHAQVAAEGRRNKVPLEKGFSQVDWLRVARSGADLTGDTACTSM